MTYLFTGLLYLSTKALDPEVSVGEVVWLSRGVTGSNPALASF